MIPHAHQFAAVGACVFFFVLGWLTHREDARRRAKYTQRELTLLQNELSWALKTAHSQRLSGIPTPSDAAIAVSELIIKQEGDQGVRYDPSWIEVLVWKIKFAREMKGVADLPFTTAWSFAGSALESLYNDTRESPYQAVEDEIEAWRDSA